MSLTKVHNSMIAGASVNVVDFGAVGDGVADDTAAIQAAIDYVWNNGGGTVYIPNGSYSVSTLTNHWDTVKTVAIAGDGQMSTRLIKRAGTTTPVIDFSAETTVLETYSSITDLRIVGYNKTNHGLRLTTCARFSIRNIRIDNCNNGIDNNGSLVFSVENCSIQANNIGYNAVKSGTVHPNLVVFVSGNISSNTKQGMNFVDGDGVSVYGTDISGNGTVGDATTGGVFIRSTVTSEIGIGSYNFNGVWMESNKGNTIYVENTPELIIGFNEVSTINNPSNNAVEVLGARTVTLVNHMAGSVGDTVTVTASNIIAIGGNIAVPVFNSANVSTIGLSSQAGTQYAQFDRIRVMGNPDTDFRMSDDTIAGGVADDTALQKLGAGRVRFRFGATVPLMMSNVGLGFNGAAPYAKPTITGSKGGNAALNDLLLKLQTYGLIVDNTT